MIACIASTASWPVLARRREAERRLEAVEQACVGLFGDADRAVALHVGMAAQRADAGAGLADIAAQQQQVGDLLHVLGAVSVLRDAHAVGDDRRVRPGIDGGDRLDRGARQAGSRPRSRPSASRAGRRRRRRTRACARR